MENLIRIHFKLPPEEVIPDYVLKYITLQPVYSEEDLNWARSVAKNGS